MTQGGYQVIIILPIKSKMAAASLLGSGDFLRFLYFTESSPPIIQSPRFTNDYEFSLV